MLKVVYNKGLLDNFVENVMVQLVADIVEANGKTIRENNREKSHEFALGSLVEVTYNNSGLRLYVVQHSRDCDGAPLYNLSFDLDIDKKIQEHKSEQRDYKDYPTLYQTYLGRLEGAILRHYGGESLKLIKTPEEVLRDHESYE